MPTSDEIAKELANPNTALASLKFQNQFFSFDGDLPRADDQDMYMLFFQPTLPFPLESGRTVWVRPGVPLVVDQPVYDSSSRRLGSDSGLGDITLDVQYGATLENGLLWSVGFSSVIPTASNELGSEQWALGPGFQLGYVSEKTVFGVFANHQWDIAGDGKSTPDLPFLRRASTSEADISLTAIQLFGVVLPGDGSSVGSAPIMTYNHESSDWDGLLESHIRKDLHYQRSALGLLCGSGLLRRTRGCYRAGMDEWYQRGSRGRKRLCQMVRVIMLLA